MHINCQSAVPEFGVCLQVHCPSPDHCMLCTECEEMEYQCQCDRGDIMPMDGIVPGEEFEDVPF